MKQKDDQNFYTALEREAIGVCWVKLLEKKGIK